MKYKQRMDGEGFEIAKANINGVMAGLHKIACCDCGLVHKIAIVNRRDRFELATKRDERATAQRRRRKHVCK